MMEEIDSDLFGKWIAYCQIEGTFGQSWLQTGQVCAAVVNCLTTGKKYSPEDFMPIKKADPVREQQENYLTFLFRCQQWNALESRISRG